MQSAELVKAVGRSVTPPLLLFSVFAVQDVFHPPFPRGSKPVKTDPNVFFSLTHVVSSVRYPFYPLCGNEPLFPF